MNEDQLRELMGISLFSEDENNSLKIFSDDESLDGTLVDLQIEVYSQQETSWSYKKEIEITFSFTNLTCIPSADQFSTLIVGE